LNTSYPGQWTRAETQYHRHAIELAQQHVNDGCTLLIVIGGDGTVSQVVHGYVLANGYDKNVRLGVIAAGTGGDFGRTLDITGKSLDDAWDAIVSGDQQTFDVGHVTYTDFETTDQHESIFVNIASFGVSGETVYQVARSFTSKMLAQSMVYTIMGAVVNLSYKSMPIHYKATTDGEDKEAGVDKLYFGAVCNARYFGGNMHLCPTADPTDGYLDHVLIQDVGLLTALSDVMPGLKAGDHLARLGPQKGSVEKVKVLQVAPTHGHTVHIELDGESVGKLPATFSVKEKSLRVMVPKGWQSTFTA
jgi:YegS/Rv2252/BmrU family lipid kinase